MSTVADPFSDVDATVLSAHVSPDGYTWATLNANAQATIRVSVGNGRARMNNVVPNRNLYRFSFVPNGPVPADYEVCATVLHESNTSEDSEVWARIPAGTVGGYCLRVTSRAAGARVLLIRMSTVGVETILGTFDTGVVMAGLPRLVQLRVVGTLITATYNGTLIHSVVDATFAGPGHAGLGGQGAGASGAHVFIDDFSVYDLIPTVPVVVAVEEVEEVEEPFCQGVILTQDEPGEIDLSGPFARCDHAEFIVLPLL